MFSVSPGQKKKQHKPQTFNCSSNYHFQSFICSNPKLIFALVEAWLIHLAPVNEMFLQAARKLEIYSGTRGKIIAQVFCIELCDNQLLLVGELRWLLSRWVQIRQRLVLRNTTVVQMYTLNKIWLTRKEILVQSVLYCSIVKPQLQTRQRENWKRRTYSHFLLHV